MPEMFRPLAEEHTLTFIGPEMNMSDVVGAMNRNLENYLNEMGEDAPFRLRRPPSPAHEAVIAEFKEKLSADKIPFAPTPVTLNDVKLRRAAIKLKPSEFYLERIASYEKQMHILRQEAKSKIEFPPFEFAEAYYVAPHFLIIKGFTGHLAIRTLLYKKVMYWLPSKIEFSTVSIGLVWSLYEKKWVYFVSDCKYGAHNTGTLGAGWYSLCLGNKKPPPTIPSFNIVKEECCDVFMQLSVINADSLASNDWPEACGKDLSELLSLDRDLIPEKLERVL